MSKVKIFEMVFDPNDPTIQGVDCISLVHNPAIEKDFIYFNNEGKETLKPTKFTLAKTDTEKRIVCGPALIPNKQIYRYDKQEGEYYIYFSENTIEKIAQMFFKNKFNNNVNIEHEIPVSDITVFESWLKSDEKLDKSIALGYDNLPIGTWFVSMYINNDAIWDKIKAGEVLGFSIEAQMIAQLQMSQQKTVTPEDEMVEKIKQLLDIK